MPLNTLEWFNVSGCELFVSLTTGRISNQDKQLDGEGPGMLRKMYVVIPCRNTKQWNPELRNRKTN